MDASNAADRPNGDTEAHIWVPPVLMYHSISPSQESDPYRLRVHPDRLHKHLRFLRRCGLRGVPLERLLRAERPADNRGLFGLTFDDGYADFEQHAIPVLARHGMSATVYVVAGRVGGVNDWDDGPVLPLLDADGVRAVASAGHEIGSHTMTHPRLTDADAPTLPTEIGDSRRVLEEIIQSEIRGFCYPYGNSGEPARAAVRAAGYDYACVTGDYLPGDRLSVPRCYVSPDDTRLHLVARMLRHRARLGAADHRLRRRSQSR